VQRAGAPSPLGAGTSRPADPGGGQGGAQPAGARVSARGGGPRPPRGPLRGVASRWPLLPADPAWPRFV